MDAQTIYAIVGILIFSTVVYYVLRSDVTSEVQSKDEKRYEIINGYRERLSKELEPLTGDNKARLDKKVLLLKEFSDGF